MLYLLLSVASYAAFFALCASGLGVAFLMIRAVFRMLVRIVLVVSNVPLPEDITRRVPPQVDLTTLKRAGQ